MSSENRVTYDKLACDYLISSLELMRPAIREMVINTIFYLDAVDQPVELIVASKEQAIKILDDPAISPQDYLAAILFAHAYKEVQKILQKKKLNYSSSEKAHIPTLLDYVSHH